MCKAMNIFDEQHVGMKYLQRAIDIFVQWKRATTTTGLTCETFTACTHSMGAMLDLAEYLQQRHGFCYVLPGKFLSDPIEGRFGWYRQVHEGNFYISIHQIMQAEKKIRCLSLLQQQALMSASMGLDAFPLNDTSAASTPDLSWLIEILSAVNLDDLSQDDANVIFFVSGYIARSISRRRKCNACKLLLVDSYAAPEIQKCAPTVCVELFESVDRGGLSAPTQLCFATTAIAVQLYTALASDAVIKKKLLGLSNQRSAFTIAVSKVVASHSCKNLLQQHCRAGHLNFERIIQTAFNCFAKNELKRLNAGKVAPETLSHNRKIRKLTSGNSSKT